MRHLDRDKFGNDVEIGFNLKVRSRFRWRASADEDELWDNVYGKVGDLFHQVNSNTRDRVYEEMGFKRGCKTLHKEYDL